jgi:hypothetical protein
MSDGISTDEGGVPDTPRDTNRQSSNLTQLDYLSRICKALELQAAIAQENRKKHEEDQEYYRKRRKDDEKRRKDDEKRRGEEDPTAVVRLFRAGFGPNRGIENFIINSEPLVKVVQDVAGFYPGVNLNSNPISIPRPFNLLYHTLPALRQYVQESRNDDEASKVLRDHLLPKCDEMFAELFQSFRCAFAAGDVFYLALGSLFRPGSLLLAVDALNQQQLFMYMGGEAPGYSQFWHGRGPNWA